MTSEVVIRFHVEGGCVESGRATFHDPYTDESKKTIYNRAIVVRNGDARSFARDKGWDVVGTEYKNKKYIRGQ